MLNEFDTIAAIATAVSNAGIGIIRISGSEAMEILAKIFEPYNKKADVYQLENHRIYYGNIKDGEEVVDECIVLIMKGPHSYTKEDVVEIDCHGGVTVVYKVLNLVLKNGARAAEPGEFTKRAFLNGRIDLSQAEAVMDLIDSKNEMARKNSMTQLKGGLSDKIKQLREEIIYQIAFIESALDDPEHYSLDGFPEKLLEEDKKVAKDGEDCTHACCWNCKHHGACPYHIECYASAHRPVSDAEDNSDVAAGQEEILADPAEESKTEDWQQEEKTDLELVLQMHRGENELLSKFLKIPGIEPNDEHLRKQELKVRALEQMLEKMKAGEFEEEPVLSEPEQPELPVMKNDKERKEWLAAYQDWGIWYRDENIGATYYKYDFENGARLIVEEYENILSICGKEKKTISGYYHLVGGPEPARSNRVEKWTRHERYTKYPNSETELVEFLKEVQRK